MCVGVHLSGLASCVLKSCVFWDLLSLPHGVQRLADEFSDHVELEVHGVAGLERMQAGDLPGMGDDITSHRVFGNTGGGEGTPVDGDGAARNDLAGSVRGQAHAQDVVLALLFERGDGAGAIDMALDHVAGEAIAEAQGTLEIDERADAKRAEVRHVEGFAQQVEADAGSRGVDPGGGEAAAVDGDRFALGEFADGKTAGGDGDAPAAGGGIDGGDAAGGFNDAGEHDGPAWWGGNGVASMGGWRAHGPAGWSGCGGGGFLFHVGFGAGRDFLEIGQEGESEIAENRRHDRAESEAERTDAAFEKPREDGLAGRVGGIGDDGEAATGDGTSDDGEFAGGGDVGHLGG